MDEGWHFKQQNFRMADVLNLNINERFNVERANLRVTKIRNENWEVETSKLSFIKR